MGFSRQGYWSGLPFPSPGDLPDPGIEPRSPTLQEDALLSELPVKHAYVDSVGKGEGEMFQENSIETCILSRVKQITSPGWMHETSARAWCTGKTQRDRVEREVAGGTGMGNTCKSMANSFQCMTKTTHTKKNSTQKLFQIPQYSSTHLAARSVLFFLIP